MIDGTTIPRQQDLMLEKPDAFIPNYLNLSEVKTSQDIGDLFDENDPIPDESSLMILNVNFPFDNFMNKTNVMYADDLKISSLYIYDWLDHD
ncbi:MAG: hypothetical protein KC440_04180, partial [Nitrosarchaeum sp.]|nr:hypothetical protein [Nitrosarchaeum sp.]